MKQRSIGLHRKLDPEEQFIHPFGFHLTKEMVDDPEMLDEFLKAYHMAAPYREKVQFRKDLICNPNNFIGNCFIYNETTDEVLVNANRSYICEELGG